MLKDRDVNFQEHSILLSEIALCILNGKDIVLSIPGIREIVALYLLVPYITNDQLETGMSSKMPNLDLNHEFVNGVSLKNLRDAICHSFVSVEESSKDQQGRIIIDDRSEMNRNKHHNQTVKSKAVSIDIKHAHLKLKVLHEMVINSIK